MNPQDTINRYLTLDQKYIKRMSPATSIETRVELFQLLKWWLKLSKSDSIGNLGEMNNNTALVILNEGANSYYINADTKRAGVIEFLENKENNWHTITNERGAKNKITNRPDKEPIEGFYMYRSL